MQWSLKYFPMFLAFSLGLGGGKMCTIYSTVPNIMICLRVVCIAAGHILGPAVDILVLKIP
jgi:hypothetical protein